MKSQAKSSLGLIKIRHKQLTVLCLGAHSDDIEIGCGGTLLRLLQDHPESTVVWVVFSARGPRKQEALKSARTLLHNAGTIRIITKTYKESFFPYHGETIKKCFEDLKATVSPDLIFTHYREDLHQDHRIISELTWNTFRKHQILEYEVPKYDGDLGRPNFYVPLTTNYAQEKVAVLMRVFATQQIRPWFSEDTFFSLMRLRGVEANSSEKHAEAFYARKVILAG
ncbi:putative LmbE-like protein [Candidatus Nitrospira nitrosa]|uniref:Putative LmbE-like protein n=1 Tax=Candidatus Nitrospira nitrosa TaxID=1742972 RepID=A0A0S4LKX0_9BACT|nr:PIG-L deacetylase family protein [Candidatus Nitrospira nitrosa]CUS36571.1 putative LmbE-like protein [Candidatus Nitrospira nitrosa]